jgi:hypothetical protein
MIPSETPAELVGRLRAEHPGLDIHVHPLGLALWTAEHRSPDGRPIHYVVCHTAEELAARLETAETVEP